VLDGLRTASANRLRAQCITEVRVLDPYFYKRLPRRPRRGGLKLLQHKLQCPGVPPGVYIRHVLNARSAHVR